MRVFAYIARRYNSAAEATSLLSSVASLVINVKFKMIGMLLNVVQGPKSEKPTMHITNNCNGFHYTLLTMHGANVTAIRVNGKYFIFSFSFSLFGFFTFDARRTPSKLNAQFYFDHFPARVKFQPISRSV